MTSYLNNGYDVINYTAEFERFSPHSIIIPSFMTIGSQMSELDRGPPSKIGSQNTPYKLGLISELQSVNPSREAISVLSAKYKRLTFVHPVCKTWYSKTTFLWRLFRKRNAWSKYSELHLFQLTYPEFSFESGAKGDNLIGVHQINVLKLLLITSGKKKGFKLFLTNFFLQKQFCVCKECLAIARLNSNAD